MNDGIAPRKPIAALLMSLLLPGLGQLYNGECNKAIWLFMGFTLLTGPAVAAIALWLPSAGVMPLLIIALLLTLAIWVGAMLDGWRTARRRQDHLLAPWQTSGVYVLVLLLFGLLILPGTMQFVRSHEVESFSIASASMAPNLLRNDIVFADKRYNCPGCKTAVRRGDIAIFTYPNDRTQTYVKRIIGLPGDHLRIEGNEVWINDVPLRQPDGSEGIDGRQWQVRWGAASPEALSTTVPSGSVFVMGDSAAASSDSRQFGPVPLDDVVGRVRQIWFSSGDGHIRWARLGMVPQ